MCLLTGPVLLLFGRVTSKMLLDYMYYLATGRFGRFAETSFCGIASLADFGVWLGSRCLSLCWPNDVSALKNILDSVHQTGMRSFFGTRTSFSGPALQLSWPLRGPLGQAQQPGR